MQVTSCLGSYHGPQLLLERRLRFALSRGQAIYARRLQFNEELEILKASAELRLATSSVEANERGTVSGKGAKAATEDGSARAYDSC